MGGEQIVVETSFFGERLVVADLDDATSFHHRDRVRVLDRRQS